MSCFIFTECLKLDECYALELQCPPRGSCVERPGFCKAVRLWLVCCEVEGSGQKSLVTAGWPGACISPAPSFALCFMAAVNRAADLH